MIEVGTLVTSPIYGDGEVIRLYSDCMISIKFVENTLPIMCSSRSMETIHSGKKSKFKVVNNVNKS